MIDCAGRMDGYHLVRFEDILAEPLKQMKILYSKAGLDFSKIEKVRMQRKPTLAASGKHRLEIGYDREVVWYAPEQLPSHFNPDIDAIQIGHLSDRDRDTFLKIAGKTLGKLGYV
jgi:hypothetical protein